MRLPITVSPVYLHNVTIRKPKLVQHIGKQQVQHMLVKLIEVSYYDCLLKIVYACIIQHLERG